MAAFISYDTLTGSSARTPRSWTYLNQHWIPLSGRIKINNDLETHAPAARSWPAFQARKAQRRASTHVRTLRKLNPFDRDASS